MSDKTELEALEANFLRRISPLLNEAVEKVSKDPRNAEKILKDMEFGPQLEAQIVEASVLGVIVGRGGDMNKTVWSGGKIISDPTIREVPRMRKFLLDTTLGNSKTSLTKTLKSTDFNKIVAKQIKQEYKKTQGWQKIARGLRDSDLKKPGVLPKHLKKVLRLGRRTNMTLAQKKELNKAINQSLKQIEKLQNTGAQTQYLKKSYESVIKAVEKGTEQAIQKATERAIKNKTRYEAERIVRTESQANYGQAKIDEALNDPDVTGVKFSLSPGHAPDQCDWYAEADNFGMGAGVWRKENAPSLPIHPNGRSTYFNVFVKKGSFNKKAGEKYIKKSKNQKALLGIEGMKEFKKNPKKWPDLLKGGFKLEKQVVRLPK